MVNTRLFTRDDYGEIQEKYFADLRAKNDVDADPSGWLRTYSEAEPLIRAPKPSSRDLARYYVDEGLALGAYKEQVCALVSSWEGRAVSPTELTLCPSCGCASLITLSALKAMGVKRVLFETPAYFGTIQQAEEIGLRFELIPTYRTENYGLPDLKTKLCRTSATAVWLTQPRASLGFNQPTGLIRVLLERLGNHGFLIVDEATDQSFPAHLSTLCSEQPQPHLIRLRSFTKGMGLNGLRLAGVLHSAALRSALVDSLETLGGSIDVNSLCAVGSLADDIPRLRAMLNAASDQVNRLRSKAERLVVGTPLAINRLVNGYIGSMVADLSVLGHNHRERRARLLTGCRQARTPVMLGATMYMAKAPPTEAIRLNFFSQPEHITRGILNVLGIWESL
jgi:histidinol-phosphate/aromatic aminotransferase/cobyric acid decarboxylase-like protein